MSIVNCQLLKAIETAKLRREKINSLHIPYELFYDRPRPVSRKISEEGGKKSSLSEVEVRAKLFHHDNLIKSNFNKLDDLSLPNDHFSSETGVVLTFFASFFVSRQKRR